MQPHHFQHIHQLLLSLGLYLRVRDQFHQLVAIMILIATGLLRWVCFEYNVMSLICVLNWCLQFLTYFVSFCIFCYLFAFWQPNPDAVSDLFNILIHSLFCLQHDLNESNLFSISLQQKIPTEVVGFGECLDSNDERYNAIVSYAFTHEFQCNEWCQQQWVLIEKLLLLLSFVLLPI